MKKFIIGLLAGISAGILFAPKSGEKLRAELKKSDAKFNDFGKSLVDAASSAGTEVQTFLQSKEMQDILQSGKKSADDFLSFLEKKGGELSKTAQAELDNIVDSAIKTAKGTKKSAQKKANSVAKQVKSKADDVKKSVKKTVKKKS
jgi:gas vesicle protein